MCNRLFGLILIGRTSSIYLREDTQTNMQMLFTIVVKNIEFLDTFSHLTKHYILNTNLCNLQTGYYKITDFEKVIRTCLLK